MGLCAEHGVSLAFFTENGRFLARVQGPVSGNVLLRREQYRRSESLDNRRHCAVGGDRESGELPDGASCGRARQA